jgi:nitrogen fixation/metabolism regulation signal transduction histidine kinase
MKIKTKLAFGISFLFGAFIIVGGFSLYFTLKISNQVHMIMKDNHLSLVYTENMLQSLDKINALQTSYIFDLKYKLSHSELISAVKNFEQNQADEANNITEPGEKEAVKSLLNNFKKYKALLDTSIGENLRDKPTFYLSEVTPVLAAIKTNIFTISDLNMQAIIGKSNRTNETASHSYLVLSIITTICFFIFFVFIFGFPSYIANPIKELTEGVREIAERNFTTRMNFVSNDEFGEISNAFNLMAGKLEEYDSAQSAFSLKGKERAEAVMNTIQDALVILDENKKIAFINSFAEKILDLNAFQSLNKQASDLASRNDTLQFLFKEIEHFGTKENQTILLDYNERKARFFKEVAIIRRSNDENEPMSPIGYMIFLKLRPEIAS